MKKRTNERNWQILLGLSMIVEVGIYQAGYAEQKAISSQEFVKKRDMILVPGGAFQMGSDQGNVWTGERPAYQVKVTSFYLDRTEVTVAQYQKGYLDLFKSDPSLYQKALEMNTKHDSCNLQKDGQAKPGEENHPINCVTYFQAEAYCQKQGKRLPTEMEWEYTARGTRGSTYPWGEEPPTSTIACWSHEYEEKQQARKDTCPVGSYPETFLGKLVSKSKGEQGIYDLAGNLSEWTSSSFEVAFPKHQPRGEIGNAVIKGSSFDTSLLKELRAFTRYPGSPYQVYIDVGFRCAKSK